MKWILGAVVWLAVVGSAIVVLGRHDAQVKWLPELRFAGVDAIYALRRVSAEADLILLLDEVKPPGSLGDLLYRRVDLDLRRGPVGDMLGQIRSATQTSFEYRVEGDFIYVRSNLPLDAPTRFDKPVLDAMRFEGDFEQVTQLIRVSEPTTFMRANVISGTPKVSFDLPAQSSILDLLFAYARASGSGWHLQRADYQVASKEKQKTVLPSQVRLWNPIPVLSPLPANRGYPSTAYALAKMALRTGSRICVFDRTPIGQNRGALSFEPFTDPDPQGVEEGLENLSKRPNVRYYDWERDGDLYVVRSSSYSYYPVKTGFTGKRLRGGTFTGTLGEFARFINSNLVEPGPEVVLGGEIGSDDPVATVEIEPGSTVEQALIAYAKAGGSCWFWIGLDRLDPLTLPIPQALPEHSYVGAFLSRADLWAEPPDASLK